MNTQTSLVAESIRLKQWSEQIRQCQNRPSDMEVDDWCRQQGITRANYYYRLRRVRQAILGYSAEENSKCKPLPDFMELPVKTACLSLAIPMEQKIPKEPVVSAVIRGNNGITIDVFPETSPEILRALVRALAHA